MSGPFFSVIVPTYNRADMVTETVESILAQTFKDLELIIVDDGSTDNTKEVIARYLSDPRVQYIYQENKERGAARNRGAGGAKGRYLLFLDSDDIALPQHLEKAHALITKRGTDKVLWLHGNYSAYINGRVIDIKRKSLEGWILKKLLKINAIWIGTVVIRKDFFDQLLFDESLSISEDREFAVRAAFKAPVFYQPEPTVLMREHNDRSMRSPQLVERDVPRAIDKIFSNNEMKPITKKYRRIAYSYCYILILITWFSAGSPLKAEYYLKKAFKENPAIIFNPKFIKWFLRIYVLPLKNFSARHNRVLYITYNGLCQPLGQSQVVPYLVGLSQEGYKIAVLSFEHRHERDFEKEMDTVKTRLDRADIRWVALKYHKHPRFFSSVFDILHGLLRAFVEFLEEPYGIVHARSYVPAMIGLVSKKMLRTRFIFDMRGMMADEKVDAGQWTHRSMSYRITKWAEKKMLENADAVVVLTEKIKAYLRRFAYIKARITVIPTCVDTRRFPPMSVPQRNNMRRAFGLSDDRLVVVYSGSLGTWYLFDKMVEFFKATKTSHSQAFFLILNRNERGYAEHILGKYGIEVADYMIKSLSPDDVHGYLWASDIGLSFIKPSFSKQSSAPTKLAEYLACGLPVIANAGVGDVEEILGQTDTGAVVHAFNDTEYMRAFEQAMGFARDPAFRQRAHQVVEDTMSVEVGVGRYKGIYDGL